MDEPLFSRIRELIATDGDTRSRRSFARNFDASIRSDSVRRGTMAGYESDLAYLDERAWESLKIEAGKRLLRIDARGWRPLFDLLNEVKGYRYLAALGCVDITFVAPSYDHKSPDLMGTHDGRKVLCEVKTINVPNEIGIATAGGSQAVEEFFAGKVTRVIAEAKAQLCALNQREARKIIYLIFQIENSSLNAAKDFALQVDLFLGRNPVAGVEVAASIQP